MTKTIHNHRISKLVYTISYAIFLVVLCACSQTKFVPEDKYLLAENHVVIIPPKDSTFNLNQLIYNEVTADQLLPIIKQQPNRKIFLLGKFHLWLYNRSNQNRIDKKIPKKINKIIHKNEKIEHRDSVRLAKDPNYEVRSLKDPIKDRKPSRGERLRNTGEAPILLDTNKIKKSSKQLSIYLLNNGFFHNQVRDSIVLLDDTIINKNGKTIYPKRKHYQKADVYYIVEPHKPFKVINYTNGISDSMLYKLVNQNFTVFDNKVQIGENFNIDKLEQERKRLTDLINNNGYFYFNKEFVYFDVDSNEINKTVSIIVKIQNYKTKSSVNDEIIETPHKPYKIGKIVIYVDHSPKADTSRIKHLLINGVDIAYNKNLKIKPEVYTKAILLKENELYQKKLEEDTYKKLNSLGTFKTSSLQFSDMLMDGYLALNVFLTPAQAQTLTLSTDGTHTSGLFGIEGALAYNHANTFGGAERLQISLTGGIEMQRLIFEGDTTNIDLGVDDVSNLSKTFNTLEFGPRVSLTIPRFLFFQKPIERKRNTYFANPKTEFSATLNYQNRPDFRRSIQEVNFSYIYNENPRWFFKFTPIELSAIEIEKSVAFQNRIDLLNDRFLAASYQNHIIAGGKLAFQFNGQDFGKYRKNAFLFKNSIEFAGHSLRAIFDLTGKQYDNLATESYNLFNIRFAQFIKLSSEFSNRLKIGQKSKLASRLAFGLGLPMGNLKEALPFEKSFFTGGTNNIRAWKSRTLGPGSYYDPDLRFDKIGDLLLEGNIEIRFPFSSWIEGALFADAGNIWLLNQDSLRPGAEFEVNDFISEIAMGTGMGMRFDLDFFIIRLDLAMPFKNPSLPTGERWIFQGGIKDDRFRFYKPQLNLGIGYPF